MDTLNTIIKLVEKDCFMASIDLKDAYYSVPMAISHRKYLRFSWRGQLYQFTWLPNGLSCGPRKFTKLLKPAITKLHSKGSYLQRLYRRSVLTREDLSSNTIRLLLRGITDGILTGACPYLQMLN